METRPIGSLQVTLVGIGCNNFGRRIDDQASHAVVHAALDAGINFFDNADIYGGTRSEELLGQALGSRRKEAIIATKFGIPINDQRKGGASPAYISQAVNDSLKRLGTDYIDLYWVHIWDQITPVEEVMRGLDDLVRAGKILYVGISDAPAWWIAQANTLAELRGWSSFIGLQLEYSLIERTVERELIPMAKALNLGVTAWGPLSGGVLTGKYHGQGTSEAGRMHSDMLKGLMPEQNRADRVVAAVKAVSDETSRSMGQVSLAWLRHRAVPVIPILGARKLSQLQDNLASFDLTLSADQLQTLEQASQIEPGFPYSMYTKDLARSVAYGGMRDRILAENLK